MHIPRPLRLILAAYLAIASLYALATPAFEVSDEPLHVAFAQHLADGGALPVQRPGLSMDQAPWQQEGSQPPLYYALLAMLAQPFDRSDFALVWRHNPHARQGRADAFDNFNQMLHDPAAGPPAGSVLTWTLLRFVGVLCGAVAAATTWALAMLFSGRTAVAALAAGLTAFNPMFVHIMASVNNDTLATALVSCALLLGARQLSTPPTLQRSLLLGVVLGCAALTKVSGLVVAAILPCAVLLRVAALIPALGRPSLHSGRSAWSAVLRHACALALPIAAIAGWWYVRNLLLYGDPTGTYRMAEVAGLRTSAPSALQILGEWEGFYMAYWGLFGAVNIALPTPIYDALEVLLALGVVGLLLSARDTVARRTTPPPARVAVAALCAVVLAATFVAFLRWTSITLASQGRLLFPVIAAASTLWAAGLLRLLRRPIARPDIAVAALAGSLAALTLAALPLAIRPAFALPERMSADTALPADMTPTELRFENTLRWIGYRVNTPAGRIGDDRTLDVSLYMQALAPTAPDTTLFVRVLQTPATNPTAVAFYKSSGGGGMYEMQRWRPDEIIVERIRVRIPDDFSLRNTSVPTIVQSALAIDVGFIDAAGRFLEPTDASGAAIGRPNFQVAAIAPLPVPAPTSEPPLARFERAELISGNAVRAEDAVDLTLRWRTVADFPAEYTVFVHVYAGDERIAQADGPAASGDFPTRWWHTGDVVTEVRRIPLPANRPPGALTLRVGLYKPHGDFARMPGTNAAGAPLPDAAAVLSLQSAP